jgi:signal transduction histidine kinase
MPHQTVIMRSFDAPLTVLAVEDDRTYSRIILTMLGEILPAQSRIDHATSASEARTRLGDGDYDCILLDLHLPDGDGIDFAHICTRELPDLAIIVLTAEEDQEVAMRSLQAGAEDYLIKGEFTQRGLARAIRYAIERKSAQRDKRLLSKALADQRAVNELQSDFIRLVSHEFRTPLGIISSSLQLLEHRIPQELKAQGARQFAKVRDAIGRLTRLMDNVLLLNQMHDGKLHFQPIGFSFAQVLERVTADFQRNMGAHRLKVMGDALPEHFFGDQYLMEVILTNVISNAFKYSPPEKPVVVEVTSRDAEVTIAIRDEGVGMSAAALARVGEKFYRSKNVSHIEGMGLGVYLTRRLVEYHQGQMSITSAEGEGTSVTLFFPRLSFAKQPRAAHHAA